LFASTKDFFGERSTKFPLIKLQGGPKKLAHFVLYALTSSNIDRFSNLFSARIREHL